MCILAANIICQVAYLLFFFVFYAFQRLSRIPAHRTVSAPDLRRRWLPRRLNTLPWWWEHLSHLSPGSQHFPLPLARTCRVQVRSRATYLVLVSIPSLHRLRLHPVSREISEWPWTPTKDSQDSPTHHILHILHQHMALMKISQVGVWNTATFFFF